MPYWIHRQSKKSFVTTWFTPVRQSFLQFKRKISKIILEFYAKPLKKPQGPPPDDGGPAEAPPQGDGGDDQTPLDGGDEGQTPQNKPVDGSENLGAPKEKQGGGGVPPKPFFDGTTCVTPIRIEDFINAMSVLYLKVGWKNLSAKRNSDHSRDISYWEQALMIKIISSCILILEQKQESVRPSTPW